MSKSDWIKQNCKFAAWPESLGPGELPPGASDVPAEMPNAPPGPDLPSPPSPTSQVQQYVKLANEALSQADIILTGRESTLFSTLEEALDAAQMYARQAYEAAQSGI